LLAEFEQIFSGQDLEPLPDLHAFRR
jgi:hypothetical protein